LSAGSESIGILGGTGKEGRGLATRWARAGRSVSIGSRDIARAEAAAIEVAEASGGKVRGVDNSGACEADVVVLTTPFAGLDATVSEHATRLAGKVVVSAVNPLRFDAGTISTVAVAEGSAAELVAARLPGSRVGAAFHNLSSKILLDLAHEIDEDVPVVADDEAAELVITGLCADLGARGVAVGPLTLARYVEGFTAVLLTLNRRRKTQAGIRFTGID